MDKKCIIITMFVCRIDFFFVQMMNAFNYICFVEDYETNWHFAKKYYLYFVYENDRFSLPFRQIIIINKSHFISYDCNVDLARKDF